MLEVSTEYPQTILKIQQSDVISVKLDWCNCVLPATKFYGVFLSNKLVKLISELCLIFCLFCWSPIGVSGISSPDCEMVCGCEQSLCEKFDHVSMVCFVYLPCVQSFSFLGNSLYWVFFSLIFLDASSSFRSLSSLSLNKSAADIG